MTDFKKWGLYVLAACLTFSLAACSEDEEGNTSGTVEHNTPSGPTNLTTESMAAYAAKYNVTSPGSEWESFEFLADGTYIITRAGYTSYTQKKEEPAAQTGGKNRLARVFKKAARASRAATDNGYYLYGTYKVETDGSYTLEGGHKVIISPDVTTITFTHNGVTNTIDVQKTQQAAAGENTRNLCRTWACEKVEEYGYQNNILTYSFKFNLETKVFENYYFHPALCEEEGVTDQELLLEIRNEILNYDTPAKVVFTPAGTYFVTYMSGDTEMSTWKWSNEANGTLFYDWEEDDDDSGYINITFNDKRAYVKEDTSEYEDGDHYRDVSITTLRAQ